MTSRLQWKAEGDGRNDFSGCRFRAVLCTQRIFEHRADVMSVCCPSSYHLFLGFSFLCRILAMLGGRNSPKTWRLTSALWPWWSQTVRLSSGWSWPAAASSTTSFWPGSFSHSTSYVRSSFLSRCDILRVSTYLCMFHFSIQCNFLVLKNYV